jgi:hypothetical protein
MRIFSSLLNFPKSENPLYLGMNISFEEEGDSWYDELDWLTSNSMIWVNWWDHCLSERAFRKSVRA